MSLKTYENINGITVSSLKDQENTNLGPPMKKGAGNISHSADPCNNIQVVNSKRKRRADDNDGQMPSKKMRSSNPINPTEQRQVSVEDKGKANVDTRPPEKKTRSGGNTSEPKAASGKNSQLRSGKRKASDDGDQPKKQARCSDQTNKPEASPEVKKESRQEQKLSSCTGKTSRENTNLGPPMKKGAGNISHSADPCNNIQVVNSKRKRRADDNDGQMPSKKMRSSNPINPTEQRQVSVEDKGKANVDTRPPENKTRSGGNTSEPKAASGKNSQLRSDKRKASDDGDQPKKQARCSDQTNKPEASPEVKKESRQEQKLSSCTGKTSRENTNLGPPMKKGAGNISHSADPCNNIQVVNSKRKRRADDNDGQMPSKKMRSSNPINPTEQRQVSVEDKGKANVDTRPPENKTRSGGNTSEPKAASGKNSQLRSGKRKASDDGDQPKKQARCSDQTNKPEASPEVKKESRQEQKLSSCTGKTSRADFQEKYLQLKVIGKGGFGSVFAGVRKADGLPVAIKHIPSKNVLLRQVTRNGVKQNVYLEVDFMIATAGHPETVGQSAAVTLLDWYNLGEEIILVMERPENAMDLLNYLKTRGGSLDENEAKMILKQLVDAAIDIHAKGVFHRDIKLQNVLIHAGSNGPRVRVIDFGCGAFTTERSFHYFSGTFAIAPPEWFEKKTYWARSTTVWQLGVLFYSLLRGHQCFMTKAFMKKEIQINQALSRGVKTLLDKCLAINPVERATLQDLQHSLAL